MEPLFKVFMPKDISEVVNTILYSGKLTSGVKVKEFEKNVKNFIGSNNFLALNNYNSAAEITWELIGIKEDDEVIASPMSCLASNQPLALKKATLKWVDIDPIVGSLDPIEVRKSITSKTKAILHYHWGGYPGHIDEIIAIGKEYGIPVVEDAIESFGSEYKGKKIGNTGADYTLFSFQPVRLPTTIDGGGIIFKNEEDYKKALLLRDYGIDRSKFRDELGEINSKCDIALPGMGAGLNEIGALIGVESMRKIEILLALQRNNAQKNNNFVATLENSLPLGFSNKTNPNYWIYSFLTPDRDSLLVKLRDKGYYASKVHLRNDYYSVFGKSNGRQFLKGVDKFEKEQLSIPCGWWLKI